MVELSYRALHFVKNRPIINSLAFRWLKVREVKCENSACHDLLLIFSVLLWKLVDFHLLGTCTVVRLIQLTRSYHSMDVVVTKIVPNPLRRDFKRELMHGLDIVKNCVSSEIATATYKTTDQATPKVFTITAAISLAHWFYW